MQTGGDASGVCVLLLWSEQTFPDGVWQRTDADRVLFRFARPQPEPQQQRLLLW